jgi:hypothetical protein
VPGHSFCDISFQNRDGFYTRKWEIRRSAVGSEGMRKEVIAMIAARKKRADERKEKTPFTRCSVVYIVMVSHTTCQK